MTYNKKPFVSIILPTYNRAQLIRRCLDSVLTQMYTNWEMIILDDGSIDNTPEVIKEISDIVKPAIADQHPLKQGLKQDIMKLYVPKIQKSSYDVGEYK